ncbi:hypothetical protein HmCmsJML030_03284 [Escherichia coli]|nr:hypothetical protein HmCmsJML030_03284 [Escherichia coli]
MFTCTLRGQIDAPASIATDLSTGDGVTIAVFNLDGRPRLPAAAKGWRSVIGGIVGGKNTALIALIIGYQKRWRGVAGFGWRWVVNHFSF